MKKWIQLIILSLCCQSVIARAVTVEGLRTWTTSQKSRLVFSINGPFHYHKFSLKHPQRIVLDVSHARLATHFSYRSLSQTPVKNIRIGPHKKYLRVVLDLKEAVKMNSFALSPSGGLPHRLVVDLYMKAKHSRPKLTTKKHAAHDVVILGSPEPKYTEKPRDIIVVIDPGHGGKDPGTTGPDGVHEKDVVLAISKDLQHMINQQPGFHAVLTRKNDYYIPLRGRLDITRKDHADMFVAIHADAYKDRYASGASVFALSLRGATSEAARWLAKRENASELMGGASLPERDHLLRSVLINLSQTATIRTSLRIGDQVLHHLVRVTSLHHGRVEQAAFVVLKSPDIPSLLVETGFLSNPHQEARLQDSYHQRQLARAIMGGIKQYFEQYPPPGTSLRNWKKS